MCEQITFDSAVIERLTPQNVYNAVRPYIDSVLEKFNFSSSHIVPFEIADGLSLRYNIKNSLFSAKGDIEDSPGSRVIIRIKSNTRGARVEVPANRLHHYDREGLPFVPTTARKADWQKIEITHERLPALAESVCQDITSYFLQYPSDFGCCSRNEECSAAGKCVQPNQDMAASCYYKRNLMQGKIFYGKNETVKKKMFPPKGEWKEFVDKGDRERHYQMWGFSKSVSMIFYAGKYTDEPVACEVIGHQDDKWAVIKVDDCLHCIHGDHLFETQPKNEKIPDGIPADYVVFDFETTSKYPNHAKIVEAAAIKYKDGRPVDTFSSLINPKCHIPAAATEIHGITDEDVKCAPEWKEIQERFLEFIGDLTLVGHNVVDYDLKILKHMCFKWIGNKCIDTQQRAKKAFPAKYLAKDLGITNYKLEHLKERLALSTGPSHRALEDVKTTNALLWACENPEEYLEKLKSDGVQLGHQKGSRR